MEKSLLDRIRGGLFGVAAGDALGGTTEFMSVPEIRRIHGYLRDIVGGGVWRLAPGEVTDDTMMTLCVADGILEEPTEPLDAIGRRFMEWYHTNPKDIGNVIRHTFVHYNDSWFQAAYLTHLDLGQSAGNGTLMRCLPAALAYSELPEMERVTRLQSRMTHYDQRCDEACIIYNRIARRLLQGEDMASAISTETMGTIYGDSYTEEPDCEPNGFVVHTFRWVLHLLASSDSFSDVVQRAANLGNDSDTVGAIAGGLAGIHWGFDGIPAAYTDAILIRERLEDTAKRLWEYREAGTV